MGSTVNCKEIEEHVNKNQYLIRNQLDINRPNMNIFLHLRGKQSTLEILKLKDNI